MTVEQKQALKQKFEKGKYDICIYIIDNDLLEINLSNYREIAIDIINIFNNVRSDRNILDVEDYYELETIFANKFYNSMVNAIKRHGSIEELPTEVEEDLKNYYNFISSINSVGIEYQNKEYTKIKK